MSPLTAALGPDTASEREEEELMTEETVFTNPAAPRTIWENR